MTLRPATVDDAPAVAALIGRLSGAFLVNADGAGAQAFFESVGEAAEARYLADARYR